MPEAAKEQEGEITKGDEETLGDKGYVHYPDCGDGFMEFTYIKTYQIVHFKYVQFITCQYLNKVVFLKKNCYLFLCISF